MFDNPHLVMRSLGSGEGPLFHMIWSQTTQILDIMLNILYFSRSLIKVGVAIFPCKIVGKNANITSIWLKILYNDMSPSKYNNQTNCHVYGDDLSLGRYFSSMFVTCRIMTKLSMQYTTMCI